MSSRAKKKCPIFFYRAPMGIPTQAWYRVGDLSDLTYPQKSLPLSFLPRPRNIPGAVYDYDLSNTIPRTSALSAHMTTPTSSNAGTPHVFTRRYTLLLVLTECFVLEENCGRDNLIVR